MPQGMGLPSTKAICSCKADRPASRSALPRGSATTSEGIRYSNIEPDQERSTARRPLAKNGRPSAAQWRTGSSPLAMASRLVLRDSEASRS
ncbi:hypothetical protein D9M69_683280 [compost metagenome]